MEFLLDRTWDFQRCDISTGHFDKKYTHAPCDYSFKGLEDTIIPALDNRKFFRKKREYMKAHKEGFTAGLELEEAIKKYKSHRRIHEHIN